MTRIDRIYHHVSRADDRWIGCLLRGDWEFRANKAMFWYRAWHRLLAREVAP